MWVDDQPTVRKKSLSTGAEMAGTARILSNKYPRVKKSIWVQMSASLVSLSNDRELTVSTYSTRV